MVFRISRLVFIPLALLIISLFGIYKVYSETGDLFLKDVDLKGGTSLTLIFNTTISTEEIEPIFKERLKTFTLSSSKTLEGYTSINILTEESINASEIINFLNSKNFYPSDYSIQFVGPELGNIFFSQITTLLLIAYVFLFITNLFIYKNPVVGATIILSSLTNIIAVFGIMNLLNQKFSFAGFSSLLMLIAFAIDTNVILTTKVLSAPKEEFYEQYKKALITGITINFDLIISMLIVLYLTNSSLLMNIAQVQIIGFTADIVNAWILNAALIEVVLLGKKY